MGGRVFLGKRLKGGRKVLSKGWEEAYSIQEGSVVG